MSEHDEEQQAVAPPPPTRAGWRERGYGIKGVAAVAVAGLVIGGGAGAAIHAATADDGGRDGRPGFSRDGGRGDGFGGPGGGPPGQGQGQMPQPPGGMPAGPPGLPPQPATPPDDEVTPDGSGDTTGSGDQDLT
ncbi:hypothetical protein [Nocardioides sp.]|uniref:hypothetical protein n=1 Tax=Nocardioides sp. TaxID=35761 RepID=UPI001A324E18|nr:hypothetical protein [Nocardioides sp.]MBJ7356695.1 hypothetical protein [Nocardioides sp.]